MNKLLGFLLMAALSLPIFIFVSFAHAADSIEITANETEHTVVMPYEKSFLFVANLKNNGSTTVEIQSQAESENIPREWHVLAPTGRYQLEPGEQADFVAVFEPGIGPGQESKEETVTVPISFSWQGGSKSFDVTVKTKMLSLEDAGETAEVNVSVADQNNKAISQATILAILPSGMESLQAQPSSAGYTLSLPSENYLKNLINQYKIKHASQGYYLQVSANGFQSYFEANFLPKNGQKKTVKLETLDQKGEYQLSKTIESGYSIWWIRSSTDGKYIAVSQGAHENPGQKPPSETKVILADNSGEKLWENKTGGECWGLDIAADGKYVAAGCHDGYIYVWDKKGKEIWKKNMGMSEQNRTADQGTRVRWVKFSPDGKYLLTGPVNNTPEESGLYEISSGNLQWSFYTGDWLREGRFSSDGQTIYLSSSNGTVYALKTEDGKKKWLGLGEHVIPFMLGISESAGLIVSAGKGRAFTGLDLANGSKKWQTAVDQTITAAQMANDGSMVGSTVGGMNYGLSSDGTIKWARKYGGVGHNGVFYTKNGQYALLGGPNPTLFDTHGNILWQREKNKTVQMSSVQEQNTGGANEVWMSEDGSLIVLGGDDGKITFYAGSIKKGKNDYNQDGGMNVDRGSVGDADNRPIDQNSQGFPWTFAIAIGLIIIIISMVILIKLLHSKNH